jgi:hypothetical protein
VTDPIRQRFTPTAGLLLLGVMAALMLPSQAPARQRTWLQQLRAQFGYNPPLAPGGSRGPGQGQDGSICLITPQPKRQDQATALVTMPSPTLVSQQPLAEWRLEDSQGRKLAGALARSDRPIEGPIAWPLPPLQPDQTVILRLRSMQASGSDDVEIQLQAASASEQAQALQRLDDRRDRLELVPELLRQGRTPQALELVFAPTQSASPELLELRRLLIQTGCGANA